MRKAFTLIELLVMLGMIAVLAALAVLSVFGGSDAAKMRGAVRDVFATVRLARSTALVTQKQCIITFTTKTTGDSCQSSATITSARIVSGSSVTRARNLDGQWRTIGDGAPEEDVSKGSRQAFVVSNRDDRDGVEGGVDEGGGESIDEILFEPAAAETFKDVAIKVEMDGEERQASGPGEVDEARRSMVSTFSNVDYLLGIYRKERERKKSEEEAKAEEEAKERAYSEKPVDVEEEERHLVWQVNGRCDPHRIYVYSRGADYREGWRIRVDRFGSAKVYAPGEDEEGER